jgi:hypothetical protein
MRRIVVKKRRVQILKNLIGYVMVFRPELFDDSDNVLQ